MTIELSPETQKLLEHRMQAGGFTNADATVRFALENFAAHESEDIEDLDAETQASIQRAEEQADRGEGRPWNEVKEELQARFLKGKSA